MAPLDRRYREPEDILLGHEGYNRQTGDDRNWPMRTGWNVACSSSARCLLQRQQVERVSGKTVSSGLGSGGRLYMAGGTDRPQLAEDVRDAVGGVAPAAVLAAPERRGEPADDVRGWWRNQLVLN